MNAAPPTQRWEVVGTVPLRRNVEADQKIWASYVPVPETTCHS